MAQPRSSVEVVDVDVDFDDLPIMTPPMGRQPKRRRTAWRTASGGGAAAAASASPEVIVIDDSDGDDLGTGEAAAAPSARPAVPSRRKHVADLDLSFDLSDDEEWNAPRFRRRRSSGRAAASSSGAAAAAAVPSAAAAAPSTAAAAPSTARMTAAGAAPSAHLAVTNVRRHNMPSLRMPRLNVADLWSDDEEWNRSRRRRGRPAASSSAAAASSSGAAAAAAAPSAAAAAAPSRSVAEAPEDHRGRRRQSRHRHTHSFRHPPPPRPTARRGRGSGAAAPSRRHGGGRGRGRGGAGFDMDLYGLPVHYLALLGTYFDDTGYDEGLFGGGGGGDEDDYDSDGMGLDYERLSALDEAVHKPGLTASQLDHNTMLQTVDEASIKALEACVICLDDFEIGDQLRRLPCLCCYHRKCIDKYFKENRTCPTCRQDVLNHRVV